TFPTKLSESPAIARKFTPSPFWISEVSVEFKTFVDTVCEGVIGLECEVMRHPFLEPNRKSVVRPFAPRPKALDSCRASSRHQFVAMARHSRFEGQVGRANGQDIFNVFVVVVEGKNHVQARSEASQKSIAWCNGY